MTIFMKKLIEMLQFFEKHDLMYQKFSAKAMLTCWNTLSFSHYF